jgi:hypothetical protein
MVEDLTPPQCRHRQIDGYRCRSIFDRAGARAGAAARDRQQTLTERSPRPCDFRSCDAGTLSGARPA